MPERSTSTLQTLPGMNIETAAATTSANSAAPGFLMMYGASTAGISHIPYSRKFGSGVAPVAGASTFQTTFHAAKTAPNATPITAATRMSRVRQLMSDRGSVAVDLFVPTIELTSEETRTPAP